MPNSLGESIDVSALLIAVVGALFSIASALYFTARKIGAEFRFRRADLANVYSESILATRLQLYPELWAYLASYGVLMEGFPEADGKQPVANVGSLLVFNKNILQWNNRHSFIFSTSSMFACSDLMREVRRVLNKRGEVEGSQPITRDEYLILYRVITKLEVSLRTDLGLLEVEKLEARKIPFDYKDVSRQSGVPMG
jgi:hypothetical protein